MYSRRGLVFHRQNHTYLLPLLSPWKDRTEVGPLGGLLEDGEGEGVAGAGGSQEDRGPRKALEWHHRNCRPRIHPWDQR